MSRSSKLFLLASLATLAVGLFASFSQMPVDSLCLLALPMSAICYGLFLISLVFHHEFKRANPEEHREIPTLAPANNPAADKASGEAHETGPHRPAHA